MKWTISNRVSDPYFQNLDIKFDPYDEIVYAFFIGTNVYYFPALLHDAVLERLFGTGMVGVKYHHELDYDDFASNEIFNENEVGLTHQLWGWSVINKQLFFEILYDYANNHFTAYRYNMQLQNRYGQWLESELKSLWDTGYNSLNPNWGMAMQEGLPKLKAKIDNNNSA